MNTSSISLVAQLQDGSSRPATAEEIISAAREQMSRRVRRGTSLSSPKATRDYLTLKLGTLEREVFAVIFLDLCGVPTYVEQSLELMTLAEETGDSAQHY